MAILSADNAKECNTEENSNSDWIHIIEKAYQQRGSRYQRSNKHLFSNNIIYYSNRHLKLRSSITKSQGKVKGKLERQ